LIFTCPVEALFGSGRLDTLGEVAKRYGYRAIIITGKDSTKENGALERAIHSLKRWGAEEVILYDRVEPNPTDQMVNEASALVVENKIDYIVGLGRRKCLRHRQSGFHRFLQRGLRMGLCELSRRSQAHSLPQQTGNMHTNHRGHG
jgi:hypothetical protein